MFRRFQDIMYVYVHVMYMNINICTLYIRVHDVIYLYVHGIYMLMYVNICMDTVHTRQYSITTTIHFPSGPISLATPAIFSSAQEPLLLSSLLPFISLFRVN
jgi:hypothetical protein